MAVKLKDEIQDLAKLFCTATNRIEIAKMVANFRNGQVPKEEKYYYKLPCILFKKEIFVEIKKKYMKIISDKELRR